MIGSFGVGVGIQVVGCISVALGICIEKYAIVRMESSKSSSVVSDPIYLLGFALFLVGNVLSALALSYAAASVLAPLSCLNIVANVFFSAWLLSETVTMNDISSTLIIISGAATVVIFSNSNESIESTGTILNLIFRTESIVYVSLVAIVVLSMTFYLIVYYPSTRSLRNKKRRSSSLSELESCVNSSVC